MSGSQALAKKKSKKSNGMKFVTTIKMIKMLLAYQEIKSFPFDISKIVYLFVKTKSSMNNFCFV